MCTCEANVAIDVTFPRLPHTPVRDGTMTLTAPAASATLTLVGAE